MKKIVASLLAIMLVLSMTVAMANTNVSETISGEKSFKADPATGHANEASQQTEMWLRVKADGQINCTIPLVLVYETNIDGGSAATGEAYKITNNSTAPVAVVEVYATKQNSDTLDLKSSTAFSATGLNQYKASIKFAADQTPMDVSTILGASSPWKDETKAGTIALIPNSQFKKVNIALDFSPLSFVTEQSADGVDKTKGLHFMDIKYTVAIAINDVKGGAITNNDQTGTEYSGGTRNEKIYTYTVNSDGNIGITAN